MLPKLWRWAVESEGSTRPLALIRAGLALIAWARFGAEVMPYHSPSLARVALTLVFAPLVTAMFLGLWTRWSSFGTAMVLSVMHAYGLASAERSSWASHHVYLLAMMVWLSAMSPAGRSLSVDRWLALRRNAALPERANLWAQRLMTIQIALVYFWAAYDKVHPGYLYGERLEMLFMSIYAGPRYPLDLPWFHAVCVALSWMTVILEFVLAFGLFVPRLRIPLMAAGVAFHAGMYFALPVMTFSVTMILLYVAFFDADEVHQGIDRLLSSPGT